MIPHVFVEIFNTKSVANNNIEHNEFDRKVDKYSRIYGQMSEEQLYKERQRWVSEVKDFLLNKL